MSRLRRLALLLLPAALGVVLAVLPGRAQQASSARFAFADTTLLRDTLGLHFDLLFPLADSLQVTPDTLRALSVRYRFSLYRIVQLADSMRVPVDSLGATLERERFNPLASAGGYQRSPWFGTACCPVNVVRRISWLPAAVANPAARNASSPP